MTQPISTSTSDLPFVMPPTQDELPYSDGEPMESWRHVLQLRLLLDILMLAWEHRDDVFVGANMFVYYSPHQVKTEDYRGPDMFVVLGVPRGDRKSWVVWEEQKGPDVVIELLSDTTAHLDRTEKKQIYQDRLRVPEYFWYDPYSGELAGWALREGVYEQIRSDADGSLSSPLLGLRLVRWQGEYDRVEATWLRFATPDGTLLPTPVEVNIAARGRIAELEARLARYEQPESTE
jgi:Uma2 family endonuclease